MVVGGDDVGGVLVGGAVVGFAVVGLPPDGLFVGTDEVGPPPGPATVEPVPGRTVGLGRTGGAGLGAVRTGVALPRVAAAAGPAAGTCGSATGA